MVKQFGHLRNGISFRRWSRRAWAAFSTLGKVVRIGVLSLSCSILVVTGYSQVQNDTLINAKIAMELEADEVVVTALRAPVLQSQLMRVVQVITRDDIERSPYADLAGLLSSVGGIDIRSRGAYGMQSDVSIRGGSFDQTLILLNGINITDPQTGHHNLNLPVSMQSIARIEVLHGAGARIFGPNAFSGAINIITTEPSDTSLSASLSGGSHGFASLSLAGSGGGRRLRHHASLSGMRSDGFTRNTDFRSGNIYWRATAGPPESAFDMQAGLSLKAFGANSFYTPVYPDQFEATRTSFASLRWQRKSGRLTFTPSLYWRRHHDRFELFRYEAPPWYTSHNYHRTDVAGVNIGSSLLTGAGRTSVGIDYRFENIMSNLLGEPMPEPLRAARYDDVWYTRSSGREGLSIMAEQTVYRGRFSFSGGMLVWINSSLENGAALFPGADMGFQITEPLRWYLSVNRTLRLPTFTDLFYSGPTNSGNIELKPEEALSFETGVKYSGGTVRGEAALFHRRGRNMIDWVKSPGDEKWQSMNHTAVDFTGLEVTLSSGIVSVHYQRMGAAKSDGDLISNYLLDYVRERAGAGITQQFRNGAGYTLNIYRQHRAGGYMQFENGVYSTLTPFTPEWLADARVWYRGRRTDYFAEAENILNTRRVSIANVPQSGRTVRIGITVSIAGER